MTEAQPCRLRGQARARPTRKPSFDSFFEIPPAEIFLDLEKGVSGESPALKRRGIMALVGIADALRAGSNRVRYVIITDMKQIRLSESSFEPREGYERSVLLTNDDFGANTKLQLMRLAPNQRIKPHHHNTRTECFRIVSGTGQIKINGDVVATTDNDVVLCEAGGVHEFIDTSDTEPLTFLVIRTNDPGNEDMIWEEV